MITVSMTTIWVQSSSSSKAVGKEMLAFIGKAILLAKSHTACHPGPLEEDNIFINHSSKSLATNLLIMCRLVGRYDQESWSAGTSHNAYRIMDTVYHFINETKIIGVHFSRKYYFSLVKLQIISKCFIHYFTTIICHKTAQRHDGWGSMCRSL